MTICAFIDLRLYEIKCKKALEMGVIFVSI